MSNPEFMNRLEKRAKSFDLIDWTAVLVLVAGLAWGFVEMRAAK